MYRKVNRIEKKFGYDYDMGESKTLNYIKEEFLDNTVKYYGQGEWTKKMGRKDKYEKNLELKRPLKLNPMLKIFNRVETKLNLISKFEAFEALK
jgi:hypothetical protein